MSQPTSVALGARLLTVHAAGGRAMLEAAQEAAGSTCGVLGVTILTSHDDASLSDSWGKANANVEDEVLDSQRESLLKWAERRKMSRR